MDEFEDIMPTEMNLLQKDKYCMSHRPEVLSHKDRARKQNRGCRGWEEGAVGT